MTRPFKIAVAGTHSTGKSTFVAALLSALAEAGLAAEGVHDSAADAMSLGFPILANHSFESTAWLMSQAIRLETEASLRADVIVIDRPVPDALGYMRAALRHQSRKLEPGRLERLEEICRTWVGEYDLIFVTVLDEQVPIGPGRPDNEAFRRLAARCVADVFEEMAPSAIPLRNGEVGAAVATCMAAVRRHASR
ncbi:AAA family ATPase [Sphingomonas psychrotolerans]|uniref:NadR/Ttd14 AAA domain-containing protein n=1 Tax=Sphingomonas psychrotolerans TaxID=1327635 RepID=A0A2K8MMM5_9SPHN|nr:AAA family ATPase [Sphingomonas psychrotolerans]ATY32541.1 hypothetical protein CVN68_11610 [Sphingomonas psychrotolerans]